MNKLKFSIGAIAFALLASPIIAGAWTGAPANQSTNVDAPINAGTDAQAKKNYVTFNTDNHDLGLWVHGAGPTKGKMMLGNFSSDPDPTVKLQVGANGDGSTVKATIYLYSSDINLKKNVVDLSDALSKVLQMRGVSFDWKSTGKHDIGVVAQDVEKVYPEVVNTGPDGTKSVDYGHLVGPLIEAIKAQQAEIDTLKARISVLESK